jgi:AcrR family transcriptional regulator
MREVTRRSVTKKGLQTQAKVVSAGIECIAAIGFHNASTNKIALHAGVTWGTLQHQFGDKPTLLEAILEYGFDQQLETLRRSAKKHYPLKQRIDGMLKGFWENQNSRSSIAMNEITSSVISDPECRDRFLPMLENMRDIYNAYWSDLFEDVGMDEALFVSTQQLTVGSIRGLALEAKARSSDAAIEAARNLLADTLYHYMNQAMNENN